MLYMIIWLFNYIQLILFMFVNLMIVFFVHMHINPVQVRPGEVPKAAPEAVPIVMPEFSKNRGLTMMGPAYYDMGIHELGYICIYIYMWYLYIYMCMPASSKWHRLDPRSDLSRAEVILRLENQKVALKKLVCIFWI